MEPLLTCKKTLTTNEINRNAIIKDVRSQGRLSHPVLQLLFSILSAVLTNFGDKSWTYSLTVSVYAQKLISDMNTALILLAKY